MPHTPDSKPIHEQPEFEQKHLSIGYQIQRTVAHLKPEFQQVLKDSIEAFPVQIYTDKIWDNLSFVQSTKDDGGTAGFCVSFKYKS